MSGLLETIKGLFKKKDDAISKASKPSIDIILELGNETKIIITLSDYVTQKIKQVGREKLSDAEKTFECVFWLETEINNGGFNQYFFNSAGDYALDTVKAFEDIGANYTAKLIQKSFSVFPQNEPPRDRNTRQELLEKIGKKGEKTLFKLDENFLEYTDSIGKLLVQFVQKNKDQF